MYGGGTDDRFLSSVNQPTTMNSVAKHLLLFAATTGYQIRVFADAARRLGVEVTLATDRCHILDDPWGDRALAVKFDQVEESLKAFRGLRVDGVAAVGDGPAVLRSEEHTSELQSLR